MMVTKRGKVIAVTLAITLLLTGLIVRVANADENTSGGGVRANITESDAYSTQTILSDDHQNHNIQVEAENGTTITDLTIDYYRIATVGENGQLQAVNTAISQAAEQAGGIGDNPIDSLFRQIIDYTKYVNTSAPILYQSVRNNKPTLTSMNKNTVSVPTGLYVVNAHNVTDSIPTLVYAGKITTPASGAMFDGLAMVQGKPAPMKSANNTSIPETQPNWLDQFTKLFVQPRATNDTTVTFGAADTIRSSAGTGYNYDFRWHTSSNGTRAAFCGNPGIMQANSGSHYIKSVLNDNRIRTVLWYGYQGPASIFDNTAGTWGVVVKNVDATTQRWSTHLAISAFYLGRDPMNPNFMALDNGVVRGLRGYQDLINLARNHPLSKNINFVAWRLYAAAGSYVEGFGKLPRDDSAATNWAQAMFGSTWHPTRIEAETTIRDRQNFNGNRYRSISDSITIIPKNTLPAYAATNVQSGLITGEQIMVCSLLNYNANNGTPGRSWKKCVVVNIDHDVLEGKKYTLPSKYTDKLTFKPSDAGMQSWQPGHYWFDTVFDAHHTGTWDKPNSGGPKYAHTLNFDNWTFKGIDIPAENLDLPKYFTKASGNTTGGNGAVYDTVYAYDSPTTGKAGFNDTGITAARTWLYVDADGVKNSSDGTASNTGIQYELTAWSVFQNNDSNKPGNNKVANADSIRWTGKFKNGSMKSTGITPQMLRYRNGDLPRCNNAGVYSSTGNSRCVLKQWPAGHYGFNTKVAFYDSRGGEYMSYFTDLEKANDYSESWRRQSGSFGVSTSRRNANNGTNVPNATAPMHDRVTVTAYTGKVAKGETVIIGSQLVVDTDGDGISNKRSTMRYKKITLTSDIPQGSSRSFDTDAFTPNAISGDVKWRTSPAKYWFDITVTTGINGTSKTVDHGGNKDGNEQFQIKPNNISLGGKTQASSNGSTTANGNKVKDTLTLTGLNGYSNIKINKTTFKLNYNQNRYGDTKQASTKTIGVKTISSNANTIISPEFAPSDLFGNGTSRWKAGYYWFDVYVNGNDVTGQYYGWDVHADNMDLGGSMTDSERWMLRPTDMHLSGSTRASSNGSTTSNGNKVKDTLTLTGLNGYGDVTVDKVTFKLNYNQNRYGDTKKAVSRYTGSRTVSASNPTISGPEFSPAELFGNGTTVWKPGYYWFDIYINGTDVTAVKDGFTVHANNLDLGGSMTESERWQLSEPPLTLKGSTKATSNGASDVNANSVKDTLTINQSSLTAPVTIQKVRFRLNYNPNRYGDTINKVDKNTGQQTLSQSANVINSPTFTPQDLFGNSQATWKPGYYWFDVYIDGADVSSVRHGVTVHADNMDLGGSMTDSERWKVNVSKWTVTGTTQAHII